MSGAPRTSIARIACAASSIRASVLVANRCGSCVWSMMPTPPPFGSSQIARIAWPRTFMSGFPLEDAARHRIELLHKRGIARVGRRDERVIEHAAAAVGAVAVGGDERHHRLDQALRLLG